MTVIDFIGVICWKWFFNVRFITEALHCPINEVNCILKVAKLKNHWILNEFFTSVFVQKVPYASLVRTPVCTQEILFWVCVGSQKHEPEPHRTRLGCSSDSERDCALPAHSNWYCVNSSSSMGLILSTKKDIENEPFNLLMYFSFYWLSTSVFKPLAYSVLASCSWE